MTEIGISDLDAYQKEYLPLAQASIKASGGRLVAAGQNIVVYEGPSSRTRVAIVGDKYAKFRSFAIAGLRQ